MKTFLPQRHRDAEKTDVSLWINLLRKALLFSASLCLCGSGFAAQTAAKPLPGRLFYTPAQRTLLLDARAHKFTAIQKSPATLTPAPPMRFDGVITRSDGVATHWINGRAQVGQPSLPNLKPGQTRAQQQVYEPYQLQRPREILTQPQIAPPPANNEAVP